MSTYPIENDDSKRICEHADKTSFCYDFLRPKENSAPIDTMSAVQMKYAIMDTETTIMQACLDFEQKTGMRIEKVRLVRFDSCYNPHEIETAKITISI